MGRLKPLKPLFKRRPLRSIRKNNDENNTKTDTDTASSSQPDIVNNPEDSTEMEIVNDADDSTLRQKLKELRKIIRRHFRTKNAGKKSATIAKQFAKTSSNFLKFAFLQLKEEKDENWSPLPIDKTIRLIIRSRYDLIDRYLDQFETTLKASTLLNKWTHILQFLRYFIFDSPMNAKRGKMLTMAFEHHMKQIRRALTKQKNKDGLEKSMEKLIEQGKLPEGGLPELEAYVKSDFPWAMNLNSTDFAQPRIYNTFLSWLYSCFFMSVQGRVGGIEDMRYWQKNSLMSPDGHEFSTNFKSAYWHSYQAVSSNEMSAKGTEIYVKLARNVIIAHNGLSPHDMNADDAPLWITWNGRREYQMGKRLTDYFEMKTNGKLHITSTNIRSLFETTSNELYENGNITLEQKNSVTRLGGHNGATVQKYYIKRNLVKSVANAREVMNIVYNSNTAPDSTVTAPDTLIPTTISGQGTAVQHDLVDLEPQDLFNDMNDTDYGGMDRMLDEGHSDHHDLYWFDDNNVSSSGAVDPALISEHTMQSGHVRGCAPLPLNHCKAGQLHRAKRVIWTTEEINYTRKVYEILMIQLPEEQKRFICKYVWQHIHKDTVAVKSVFHPAHITTPQKLRHCIRTYIDSTI